MSGYKRLSGAEIVTVQVGTVANWLGAQYHLLQNSNCDVNTPYHRSTHFRRVGGDGSSSGGSGGEGSPSFANWTPRVVSLDSSVGLDRVVATYGAQEAGADSTQDKAMKEWRREQQQQQQAGHASNAAASAANASGSRPVHWTDLSKSVYSYHSKSLYSVPNLYEGTSELHTYEAGAALMSRESVHEEVLDRVRWFLEECDQPDGIHLIVEANSGWSGVGGKLLDLLRDDYEKIPVSYQPHGANGKQMAFL